MRRGGYALLGEWERPKQSLSRFPAAMGLTLFLFPLVLRGSLTANGGPNKTKVTWYIHKMGRMEATSTRMRHERGGFYLL